MDFDQMLDAWRAQDQKPLYGVNRDLLRLVLQHEQAEIRRRLRVGQWVTFVVGPGMALFAAFWLWVVVLRQGPVLQTLAAAFSTALFVVWVTAAAVSRHRQARRERDFGSSVADEIRRGLSLVDYQIRQARWRAVLSWTAPVMIGALLLHWLTFQINTDTGFSTWQHVLIVGCVLWSLAWSAHAGERQVRRELEPRRRRLQALLDGLRAAE